MSSKVQENGQERAQDFSTDSNSTDQTGTVTSTTTASTTTERLHFLEKEYKQLSKLFHDLLATRKPVDDDEQGPHQCESRRPASEVACEITHISAAEWRAIEHRSIPRNEYSLLTVGPKGHGETASWYESFKAQHEAGRVASEARAEAIKTSRSSSKKPYRMILNGRAELMEVLGESLNTQTSPGFYVWTWPFKQLIRYGDKVKARLLEEESRSQGAEGQPSVALFGSATTSEISPKGEDSRPGSEEISDTSVLHSRDTLGGYPSHERRDARDSQDKSECDRKLEYPNKAAEPEKILQDSSAENTKQKTIRAEDDAKTQDYGGEDNSKRPLRSTEEVTKADVRTTLRDELRCLVKFMDTDMIEIFSVQKSIDDGTRTTIAFDHLWQLFKPGDLIIKQSEQTRAYVVLHTTGGRVVPRGAPSKDFYEDQGDSRDDIQEREAYLAKYPKASPFALDCFYLDFDGTNFGPLPKNFMFQEYDGEVPIDSLEVYPMRFDGDPNRTERALIKRGKRFVKLARVGHKRYCGKTVREPIILESSDEVDGDIMIDFELAIKHFVEKNERLMRSSWRLRAKEWNVKFGTGVIATPTPRDAREIGDYDELIAETSAQYKPTYFMEDRTYDMEVRADFIDKTELLKERPYQEKLSNTALMLLPPRVYGFSFLDRKWYAFDLSKVDDIKDTNHGFDQLVLPAEHKKTIQALVKHHQKSPALGTQEPGNKNQEVSMDIVRGKGRGLIVLLHGVPGVGKTSTAECVAAQTKRPLFPITCGDLGTRPEWVEDTLNPYFAMAHKWHCVLLLDEADVFLTKREKGGDLHRNAIVSVFLRVLEYYSGILILTTNRIGEFDEAFSSRIHIKLYYPKLDKKSTLAVWKMNLRRIADSGLDIDVNEDEIMKFARKLWADTTDRQTQRWNGRQIRNAFQTGIALAKWDHQENTNDGNQRPCLSKRQLEVVAKTSAHFDAYISGMHGIDEGTDVWETIAQRENLRKTDTPRKPVSRWVAAERGIGGRRNGMRTPMVAEDEDDQTDSNENEEKLERLVAELKRRQKKDGPSVQKSRDSRPGPLRKLFTQSKPDDGLTSESSEESS